MDDQARGRGHVHVTERTMSLRNHQTHGAGQTAPPRPPSPDERITTSVAQREIGGRHLVTMVFMAPGSGDRHSAGEGFQQAGAGESGSLVADLGEDPRTEHGAQAGKLVMMSAKDRRRAARNRCHWHGGAAIPDVVAGGHRRRSGNDRRHQSSGAYRADRGRRSSHCWASARPRSAHGSAGTRCCPRPQYRWPRADIGAAVEADGR